MTRCQLGLRASRSRQYKEACRVTRFNSLLDPIIGYPSNKIWLPVQEKRIRGQALNLDVSTFGFALYNSSKRFGVSLGMEMGQLNLIPLRDDTSRPHKAQRDDFCFSATACVAKLDSCLGRLGKPFIHFFLVGEQLLDARTLLHPLEMRHHVGEA
jgi:hypothetical protein